ncbi:MAG: hypothetical protein IT435_16000 [Phycisphaerales bacterium]|nr:hypothetical protein [Phycisphaerales bacterium]
MFGPSRLVGFTRSLFISIMAVAALLACVACQEVGGAYRQDAMSTNSRPRSPNRIGLAQAEGTRGRDWNYNLESAGSAAYTEFNPDGSMTRAAQGTPTRDLFVTLPNGMKMTWSSGADITLKGLHIEQQGANEFTASADEFGTSTSGPQRAMNEAIAELVPAWVSLTDAEREAHLADLEAAKEAGDTLAPILLAILKSIGV